MITVIGKTYSLETQCVLDYLTKNDVVFQFIDLDFETDEELSYWHWLKANRIITIPVIKYDDEFVVGDDLPLIDKLIAKHVGN